MGSGYLERVDPIFHGIESRAASNNQSDREKGLGAAASVTGRHGFAVPAAHCGGAHEMMLTRHGFIQMHALRSRRYSAIVGRLVF